MNDAKLQSQWYQDAIIYELNLKTFADSDGDGIGDFVGLTQKLDYLQNLGVTALWLLPFYPSPLRDDGYDISDYFSVHPSYGTLKDFKTFLKAAHQRGLRVITELVLNHTSDQHRWFQESRRAEFGTRWRDFYVWSDSPHVYSEARIIFKDFEASNWTWDPVGRAYYWHRFYSHQPDLNFHNPAVREMMFKVIDFWLEMGVDGLRLDAVPYLFEREGTNCENLEETHNFLKDLRAHVDANFPDRMLLAEANQWPEDAAKYFGQGDECHMAFHFPLMPRIYMALNREDRYPIVDILDQTPAIPATTQWALFLRNHDELTLEMVTDEERDYMYTVFAKDQRARINLGIRRRLAPLLGNNRRKIELLSMLLLSLPGTPIIYYGDEIGMGDNIYLGDRNGVRTPMQWNADKNAGFSKTNPQQLFLPVIIDPEYHYETVNVEVQEKNLSSLLWWTRRLIAMRKHFKCFGRGSIRFLNLDNNKVLAFTRTYEEETILVLINLSRFLQVAELHLVEYAGQIPEEVFSHNRLPMIREAPFVITLGPYDCFWLLLSSEKKKVISRSVEPLLLEDQADFESPMFQQKLETQILSHYLPVCRWFGGKAKTIFKILIHDQISFEMSSVKDLATQFFIVEILYTEGLPEFFIVPLQIHTLGEKEVISQISPLSLLAQWEEGESKGYLIDAMANDSFRHQLLSFILSRKKLEGAKGKLVGSSSKNIATKYRQEKLPQTSQMLELDQSNSALIYGDKFFLKLYRKTQEGVNPDVEINRYLSDLGFTHIPRYVGALDYVTEKGESYSLAILQEFVANEGNAWNYAQGALGRFFERVLADRENLPYLSELAPEEPLPERLYVLLEGVFLQHMRLLGQRTAELHLALGRETEQLEFSPEPFTQLYQRSLYQSLHASLKRQQRLIEKQLSFLEQPMRSEAEKFLLMGDKISADQQRLLQNKIIAKRIRIHGDYHLGQVLFTGKDFIIIDFEGEPVRPMGERRMKRSPLYDVAGMLRSLDYVAFGTFLQSRLTLPQDRDFLKDYVLFWTNYVSAAFLESYFKVMGDSSLLPQDSDILKLLLRSLILEKALYEVGYELNHRPLWFSIPLLGIERLMQSQSIVEKLPQILKNEFTRQNL
ncbi:MAG: maltose alpha-D-glucosyltransferase [Verrucomicrobiae bacterium]|nr:maltose alpha-D-glucosyltransferase [Verrucomicrobiae bacterium]